MHATEISPKCQVYGPTLFTPLSPASTIGYSYEDTVSNVQQQVAAANSQGNDPFDFDSELALIQDCELTDECTRSLAESLKETQLELVARCLSPPVAFSDRACLPGGTSTPLSWEETSNLDLMSDEPSLSSSIHEAYDILNDPPVVIDDGPLVVDHVSNISLSPDNMLVTLEMHVGNEVFSENINKPCPVEKIPMPKSSAEIVYGEATFKDNQVKIPDSLQNSVTGIPQDQIMNGGDVSPLREVASAKTPANVAQSAPSPKINYDSAIAALKAAGTDTPSGVPIIHGDVHDTHCPLHKNYSAGIKYLLTGEEGAKKLIMSKKRKYEPNVTRFVGESAGFIKGFNEKTHVAGSSPAKGGPI